MIVTHLLRHLNTLLHFQHFFSTFSSTFSAAGVLPEQRYDYGYHTHPCCNVNVMQKWNTGCQNNNFAKQKIVGDRPQPTHLT